MRAHPAWYLQVGWSPRRETPSQAIERLQEFVAGISRVAPFYKHFVVAGSDRQFRNLTKRQLIIALKKNFVRGTDRKPDLEFGYRLELVVPTSETGGVFTSLTFTPCSTSHVSGNGCFLDFGDITSPVWRGVQTMDLLQLLAEGARTLEADDGMINCHEFSDAVQPATHRRPGDERIGWATFWPFQGGPPASTSAPVVWELPGQGAILACSPNFTDGLKRPAIDVGKKLLKARQLLSK